MNEYDLKATEQMLLLLIRRIDDRVEYLTIVHYEKIADGGWFFNCILGFSDGNSDESPVIYYEGSDWVFVPVATNLDSLPRTASEIPDAEWGINADKNNIGVMVNGQPYPDIWVKEQLLRDQRITIGRAIATARKELGLSVRDLAKRCGLAANHISRIETGKYNYNIDTLLTILGSLGLQITTNTSINSN